MKIHVEWHYNFSVTTHFLTYGILLISFFRQEYHDLLLRCIKEDLGFMDDKPIAACIIYKCLLGWRIFEAERTATFDFIIEAINDVLKVDSLILFCFVDSTAVMI